MLDLDIKDLRKQVKLRFSGAPDGHVFTVHRLGAGSELKMAELMRKAGRLVDRMQKTVDDKQLAKIYKEIDQLHEERFKLKASVFDDGGDGTLALAIASELSDQEVEMVLQAVENGTNIVAGQKVNDDEADKA